MDSAGCLPVGRFRCEADVPRAPVGLSTGRNAPEPTSRGLKSRSAAVCCRTEVCYAFGRRRGAGSVLPPIQVWPRQRGDRMKASTILLSIFALLATPLACAAQQPGKTPRIGYVRAGSPNNDQVREEFVRGMRDLG